MDRINFQVGVWCNVRVELGRIGISCALLLTLVGCSQSVDKVNIQARNPRPSVYYVYRATVDVQGVASDIPSSTNYYLYEYILGGNFLRTQSASMTFRMSSGAEMQ